MRLPAIITAALPLPTYIGLSPPPHPSALADSSFMANHNAPIMLSSLDALQCVAASVLGRIDDRRSEEIREGLVRNLTRGVTDIQR